MFLKFEKKVLKKTDDYYLTFPETGYFLGSLSKTSFRTHVPNMISGNMI